MAIVTIRRASRDELNELQAIYYATFDDGEVALPPRPATLLPALPHILDSGDLLVAEREGQIVGYAGLVTRGNVAFLTDLFVHPGIQSEGVGQTLLQHLLPRDGHILATAASTDLRAPALYIRAGMRPQWPIFWLLGDSSDIDGLAPEGITAREADVDDPDLLAWDAALCGRPRAGDLACLVRAFDARPLWFECGGRRIGYGYVQQGSPEALWNQHAFTLGPIGAYTQTDASACVLAAADWARTRGERLRMAIPGPHPALPELLRAGLRIAEIETFLSSAPFVDGARYLPSGGSLF